MSLDVAMESLKKKRKLTVEDLIGESAIKVAKEDKEKTSGVDVVEEKVKSPGDDDDVVVGVKRKSPVRRKRFISVKEFDHLAQEPPIGWPALKQDCIYRLDGLDKLVGCVVANLIDHKGRPYRAFVPAFILQMLHDKLTSESSKDKAVQVYLRPKTDNQADIAVKETFPCQKGCNEEFYSNSGRWLHHKHCMKELL